MTEARFAIVALTVALLAPQGAAAQLAPRVEAGALVTQQDGGLPVNALRLAPVVRYDRGGLSVTARGSGLFSEQQWQLADGSVSGMFTSPTVYGVRAEMISNASRAFADQSLGQDQVDVQTRIHLLFKQRGGVWVGGGVARPWRVAVMSSVDVAGAGAWTRVGNALLSGTVTDFSFTKIAPVDGGSNTAVSCSSAASAPIAAAGTAPALLALVPASSTCSRQSHFTDAETAAHWEFGTFELNAQGGYRFGDSYDVTPDSRRWASATFSYWINDRMAFVAGGGRQPAIVARGIPARRFTTVGVTMGYWPVPKGVVPVATPKALLVKSFDIRPAAPGMQKIIIRVGGVETVDVMGDFSDWGPLTLVRHGRDLWELSVPLSPGQHQINVRVDGGLWVAPPGVPTMRDGFNGEVGILVVSPDK